MESPSPPQLITDFGVCEPRVLQKWDYTVHDVLHPLDTKHTH